MRSFSERCLNRNLKLAVTPSGEPIARQTRPSAGLVQCVILVLLLLLLVVTPQFALASPQQVLPQNGAGTKLELLRGEFLKLRNTDPKVTKASEWIRFGKGFDELAVNSTLDNHARAWALFNSSIAYIELYRGHQDPGGLSTSKQRLREIVELYPQDSLAPAALFRLGEIELYFERNQILARGSFGLVAARYPKSKEAKNARQMIQKIDSGTVLEIEKPTLTRPPGVPVVIIDPGHGGDDFGAIGVGGLLEKDVTLDVALRVERILSKRRDLVVKLTRRSDQFVSLVERTDIANDFEGALFVSLHTNASPTGKLGGMESYYLDNSGDQASRRLAERENSAFGIQAEGGDLQFILSDVVQSAKLEDSVDLARTLHASTFKRISKKWSSLKSLGVKKAPFYVLVGALMPCALVEMFFIDNQVEGALLADERFREELAQGIADGIVKSITKKTAGR